MHITCTNTSNHTCTCKPWMILCVKATTNEFFYPVILEDDYTCLFDMDRLVLYKNYNNPTEFFRPATRSFLVSLQQSQLIVLQTSTWSSHLIISGYPKFKMLISFSFSFFQMERGKKYICNHWVSDIDHSRTCNVLYKA